MILVISTLLSFVTLLIPYVLGGGSAVETDVGRAIDLGDIFTQEELEDINKLNKKKELTEFEYLRLKKY